MAKENTNLQSIKDIINLKTLDDLRKPPVVPNNNSADPLTSQAIEQAVILLRDIEQNNGHRGIARQIGIKEFQVRQIHQVVQERINQLLALLDQGE